MEESMIGHIIILLVIASVIYIIIRFHIVGSHLFYKERILISLHKGTVGYSIKFLGSINQYEFWYWHWLRISWWKKFEIIKQRRKLS